MAKKITGYKAVTKNREYFRPQPSWESSGSLQVEAGYSFVIYARTVNGVTVPWEEDGFYRADEGFIYVGSVSITGEVVETTTDKCVAPKSLSLNTSTKVLTISGGAGGDLNNFTGYGISWRDAPIGTSSYGAWSSDVVVNSSNTTVTYNVTAPAGYVRQFRARTRGSAGASYYSDYVVCGTTLTGNTAPPAPTIQLPANGAKTYSKTPVIRLSVHADADGDTLTIKRQIDNGSWSNITAQKSGLCYDRLPNLGSGNHTIRYKAADNYAESSANSITITVSEHNWGRSIAPGDVISNASISHASEITELLAIVNSQRAFYGMGSVVLPGTVGRFGDWQKQMQYLLAEINAIRIAVGQNAVSIAVPNYPTASTFNEVRLYTKDV